VGGWAAIGFGPNAGRRTRTATEFGQKKGVDKKGPFGGGRGFRSQKIETKGESAGTERGGGTDGGGFDRRARRPGR